MKTKKKLSTSTSIPEVSTSIPEVSTSIPEVSTSIPEVSTSIPEVSTSIPEVSTSIPEVSTSIPEVSTSINPEELAKLQAAVFGAPLPKAEKPSLSKVGKSSQKCDVLHISSENRFKNEKYLTILFCVVGIIPTTLNNKIVSRLMKRILKISSSGVNTCYQDIFSSSKNGEVKYRDSAYFAVKNQTGNSPDCFLSEPLPIDRKAAEKIFHDFCAANYPDHESGKLYRTFYLSFRE